MIENLLGEICHRIPARALDVAGVLLPACARCTGFYCGWLFALTASAIQGRRRPFLARPTPALALAGAIPVAYFALDVALALAASPLALPNTPRFLASLAAGWGSWVFFRGTASWLRWGLAAGRRITLPAAVPALIAAAVPAALSFCPFRWGAGVLSVATLAGALAFYAGLTYLPLAAICHKKKLPAGWRAAAAIALAAAAYAEVRWGYRAWMAFQPRLGF